MHRTQLFLTENLHATLKSQASQDGRTLSEYVRIILDEHINTHTRKHTERAIVSLMAMTQPPKEETNGTS
ncbi:hypothetical protein CO180_02575 [candidate division WWE3 bacterium CG_4_9_14_3_um_filter_41_6]|uniref:Uncharacterized protein n=1 Tax=candidate division WWE3 bacterium CG_4_10_14_0_2_um_filter_41_14 TaxID=1975072 RepID=A0A2M7TJ51_UNCKA|nr:MAG: hypothetical protein COY32_03200 [candidate division WWE3 bacterium CG_4_10_14_0_2_um_filter_41_14]PJA38767.1 MAG: hypothetical protein CO180_02575 [candidate division WWE3 bacterium CG_4_9_14_3_um_filter_41_6]